MTNKADPATPRNPDSPDRVKRSHPIPESVLRGWATAYERIGEQIREERNRVREKLLKAASELA